MNTRLLGVAISALVLAGPAARAEDRKDDFRIPRISVQAASFEEVRPDVAYLSIGVVSEKPTTAQAMQDNAALSAAAIADLKAQGVEPKDIKTSAISLQPVVVEERDPKTNQIMKRTLTGYRAVNDVTVTLRDVDKAGPIVTHVVSAGANTYRSLWFDVTDSERRLDALRERAIHEAMRKAQLYAHGAGMKLGRLMAIDPDPDSGAGGAADLPSRKAQIGPVTVAIPVEPGVQRVEARVAATWELVPD